ncbi:hypothetical protein H2201_008080 [Coniosporium apollinis]|uniref:Cytochrome P450 alkane hydroxylase n=1 Tax=Coniosporium apollinis TaxID=61459 RepID=A0ABQ9NMD2_9PEZI|nr:hypothetical protein H2201_008080 [Coniosporium apollinis]
MASATLFALLIILVVYLLSIIYKEHAIRLAHGKLAAQHGCQPIASKYPLKDRIFGLDFVVENLKCSSSHCYLVNSLRRFQEVGGTYTLRIFGHPMIQSIEPENVKAVFATKEKDWRLGEYRTVSFRDLLGVGIFTLDRPGWQESRAWLRPAFEKKRTADIELYERHIGHLFQQLPHDGKTVVDLQELFLKYTMDSSTEILFGKSVDSLLPGANMDPTASGFAAAYESAKWDVFKNVQLYPFGQFRSKKALNANVAIINQFVDRYVKMAVDYQSSTLEANRDAGSVFMAELAKNTTDVKRIRSELLSLLLAGRDTTAALISNTFFVLARRPDILAKCYAEVATFNGELPTLEQTKNVKYIHWLLKESLRVHTIVPVNTRTAAKDTILPVGGGPDGKSPIFVAEGTQFVSSIYAIHRRKDIHGEDAEEFKPERWADDSFRPKWGYLPFLGGGRICPGQGLAMTEAAYTVIRLLQLFKDIKAEDPTLEWQEDLAITCCNLHGCRVILTPA